MLLLFQVRKELGIGDDVKLVIFNFGGQVSHRILWYYYYYYYVLLLLLFWCV